MSGRETLPLRQSAAALSAAAAMAEQPVQAACSALAPRTPSPASAALAAAHQARMRPAGCAQRISLALFFDGTGNNLDADEPTSEHSNVARLYRAHPIDDEAAQIYRRYIPGLGTYFREIGDPGGTLTGAGAGAYGQARLDWAFKELAQLLQQAEARAGNPSNPIVEVRLAVFGFSRGAALARAFCRDLQRRCEPAGAGHVLRPGVLPGSGLALRGGYPVQVYFLGLFDTVASVGVPMSANNFALKRRAGLDWRDLVSRRHGDGPQADLERLAFGEPGADPASGPADGHADWAEGLQIPPLVARCVHMVAAHEVRNSFPLDSTLQGNAYPSGVQEMVYPGVHSDVGGGYREGEGGKSAMLAQVPLRAMLQAAIEAGVPLFSLDNMPSGRQPDFALDPQGARDLAELMPLWREYMRGFGPARPLGASVLAHMAAYWRYRLSAALHRAGAAPTPQQQTIERNERAFAADRARLRQQRDEARRDYGRIAQAHARAEQALHAAQWHPVLHAQVPRLREQVATLGEQREVAQDRLRRLQARLDTAPDDSGLLERLTQLDAWLLDDARTLHRWRQAQPRRRMRPHYLALAQAYEEVVVQGRCLPAQSPLYRFFDRYVHDSLAGFDKDNTRPSDPRVLYVGGDTKKRYAAVPQAQGEALPA